jgi:uncharacterized protein YbjT (DUF2867 family)
MTRILVAGGTGALGRDVVARLRKDAYLTRVLSRSAGEGGVEWARGDIVTGEGLGEALAGVEIVVNCAGNPRDAYQTDVLGVKRLAEMAKAAGVRHFFHISIVGIEHSGAAFYQNKVKAEAAVIESGVPYSILRVVQFHSLLRFALSRIEVVPEGYALPIARDAQFQTIDTRDVAEYLLPLLTTPAGRLADLGGPEVLRLEAMARVYLAARGVENPVFIESPNKFFSALIEEDFRRGANTAPDNAYGRITWGDYVREQGL